MLVAVAAQQVLLHLQDRRQLCWLSLVAAAAVVGAITVTVESQQLLVRTPAECSVEQMVLADKLVGIQVTAVSVVAVVVTPETDHRPTALVQLLLPITRTAEFRIRTVVREALVVRAVAAAMVVLVSLAAEKAVTAAVVAADIPVVLAVNIAMAQISHRVVAAVAHL